MSKNGSRSWMSGEYSLNSLSGSYETKVTEPVMPTELRRELEDGKYVLPKVGSADIEEMLKEI